jgi:hypothetical protein
MTQPKKILSATGEPMLSARSAAKILSCAQDYVSKLCREGKLRGTQIQGAWFVEESSIQEYEVAREAARRYSAARSWLRLRREENMQYRKSIHPRLQDFVFSCAADRNSFL